MALSAMSAEPTASAAISPAPTALRAISDDPTAFRPMSSSVTPLAAMSTERISSSTMSLLSTADPSLRSRDLTLSSRIFCESTESSGTAAIATDPPAIARNTATVDITSE
jgi:hypothetical protein